MINNRDISKIALIIVGGLVLIYVVNMYNQKKVVSTTSDRFVGTEEEAVAVAQAGEVDAAEPLGQNSVYGEVNGEYSQQQPMPSDCLQKEQLTPSDLLPGNESDKWATANPTGESELGDQNFLTAGYHVGVNTVGQSLRNANRQIRSEPPNPQQVVSPWLQTTIGPDINRRPLEIN